MKITVLTVEKKKKKYYTDAVKEYAKRLSRSCSLSIMEVPDEPAPEKAGQAEREQILGREAERLLRVIDRYPHSHVIALAIEGDTFDSVAFSRHLSELQVRGASHFIFVIGGSLGLSGDILRRADERISFSKMTFPHQLMRVILLEQIYRALRIANNEPYHK